MDVAAQPSPLSLSEAVPLAHALVDEVCHRAGIRRLFIKGPLAASQGLRASQTSVDIDVLVDPARREELARALTELGWLDLHRYTSPTVLPQHSLTHRHTLWPCELDLHNWFPGFFVDRATMFDVLWARRTTGSLADRELPCPDRLSHALVLALHSLRDAQNRSKQVQLEDLATRLRLDLDDQQALELARLAAQLGAADSAAPFLRMVGAPSIGEGSTSAADLRAWHLRSDPSDPTAVSWVDALVHTPLRRWPRYLWYAALLSEEELRVDNPSLPPGSRALRQARLRRLRRGLAAVPGALRAVLKASRTS